MFPRVAFIPRCGAFKGVGGVPRFIRSANGSHLVDVDGHRYTDYCMSWGPLIFGHQDPEVLEAVQSALSRGWSYGAAEPYSLELAELITNNLPWVQKVRFVNSGTESRDGGASGRARGHRTFEGLEVRWRLSRASRSTLGSRGIWPRRNGVTGQRGRSSGDRRRKRSSCRSTIWTLTKPYSRNTGTKSPWFVSKRFPRITDSFCSGTISLAKAAAAARKAGALVLLDEVITGFRVGFGGVAERSGVHPDLVTYGKIIGWRFFRWALTAESESLWISWRRQARFIRQER